MGGDGNSRRRKPAFIQLISKNQESSKKIKLYIERCTRSALTNNLMAVNQSSKSEPQQQRVIGSGESIRMEFNSCESSSLDRPFKRSPKKAGICTVRAKAQAIQGVFLVHGS